VVDSRDSDTGESIRRRRECLQCTKRFTTYGRREDFDRQKLFSGLMKATTKREISHSTIERVVDEIEAELRTRGKVDIPSREVGELVMDKLRGLDEVAYIRFASVYRSFMDLQEVKHEIDQLLSREKRG
jgi:transcriptional repressor NrdR